MLNASQRLQLTDACVEGLKDPKVRTLSLAFALYLDVTHAFCLACVGRGFGCSPSYAGWVADGL